MKTEKRVIRLHNQESEHFKSFDAIYLTAEQIAQATDHLDGIANIRAINKLFRRQDESYLYPINGRFNVTERAIRRARKFRQQTSAVYGLEYCYLLDSIISEIVNQEV